VYIPTWRSQIAVVDGISRISKILAKASNIDDAVIDLLIGLYNTVIRENTKESDVENVKIQTVRAGKALIDIKTDRLVDFVKTELTGYKEREKSTIVLVDITNALKST
jgi:proteasome component ECM29